MTKKEDRTPYGRRRKASPSVVPETTVPVEPDRDYETDPPPKVVTVTPDPATIKPEIPKAEEPKKNG